MKNFISTRKGFEASAPDTVFEGLAPDGGLYVPKSVEKSDLPAFANLGEAEEYVLNKFFGDFPEATRKEAVERMLSRFPKDDPTPIVSADGFEILEL